MYFHWISLVRIFSKQKEFPEGIHPGQMFWPIDLGYVIEYKPDHFISLYFFVKAIHKGLYVFGACYVFFHFNLFGSNCQLSGKASSYQLPASRVVKFKTHNSYFDYAQHKQHSQLTTHCPMGFTHRYHMSAFQAFS